MTPSVSDPDRVPTVFLTGFMGSGKSTVGRMLARRLDRPFVDLDLEIERRAGRSIPAVFASEGESVFRDMEHEALLDQIEKARREGPRVVSLGGGAFVFERNRRAIERAGRSVWLDAPEDVLWGRVCGDENRPLAQNRDSFSVLLSKRLPYYGLSSIRVDASMPRFDVVRRILDSL